MMATMPDVGRALPHYLDEVDRARHWITSNGGATRFDSIRDAAREALRVGGLPSSRAEAWRFLDLAGWASVPYAIDLSTPCRLTREALETAAPWTRDGHLIVLRNGRFVPSLSRVPSTRTRGLLMMPLADAMTRRADDVDRLLDRFAKEADSPFVELNSAMFADGAFISVTPGASIDTPVHVVSVTDTDDSPVASYPRLVISVGRGASVVVTETHWHVGVGRRFSAPVSELLLGDGSRSRVTRVVMGDEGFHHVGTIKSHHERSAACDLTSLVIGGALVRNDIVHLLDGPGAEARLEGVYVARDDAQVDHHVTVSHDAESCASEQVFKGLLTGRARGVFDGQIRVMPGARGTSARQISRAMLLSDDAAVNANPRLEIHADEVKCSHGATAGPIEGDTLFYLRSRGIPEAAARRLLTRAFAGEVLESLPIAGMRDSIENAVWKVLGI